MNVKNKEFLAKGKRGIVYTGLLNGKKIAIKEKREESTAIYRMENEARFLQILNKKGIGPEFIESGDDYLIYYFVEGIEIMKFVDTASKKEILLVLEEVMKQCLVMDKLGINKEEMHRPLKHILVGPKVVMIDFERCKFSEKPKNVTQVCQYVARLQPDLEKIGLIIDGELIKKLGRLYKQEGYVEKRFEELLEVFT